MIFFQRIQMGGGGVWGLELVNFFSKNPNLKKEKIFFFGGGGGGGGRGAGAGGWGARGSEIFLQRIQI